MVNYGLVSLVILGMDSVWNVAKYGMKFFPLAFLHKMPRSFSCCLPLPLSSNLKLLTHPRLR